MRLYSGTLSQFIKDATLNQIADKLSQKTFLNYYRYSPPDAEKRSWKNSLRALSVVFQNAQLFDHGVILEYQLPLTSKRLDCLVAAMIRKPIITL